ncbi:hypothetical protein FKM82_022251, partial [Ascaphus truei]
FACGCSISGLCSGLCWFCVWLQHLWVVFRFVVIRREQMMTSHMEKMKSSTRLNELDPEGLRWTPVIASNTAVSEEEREAEKEAEQLTEQASCGEQENQHVHSRAHAKPSPANEHAEDPSPLPAERGPPAEPPNKSSEEEEEEEESHEISTPKLPKPQTLAVKRKVTAGFGCLSFIALSVCAVLCGELLSY